MEFRALTRLAKAWRRKHSSGPAAPPRYPGYGRIEVCPRQDRLHLSFPDNAALLHGVADLVDGFAGDRPRSFYERFLRNSVKPMIEGYGAGGFGRADGEEQRCIAATRFLLARRDAGRYQDYSLRREMQGSEMPPYVLTMSQGLLDVPRWRGIPLVKTVFDLSLYPMMLWEMKPRTILETGSGAGGSALWFADMAASLGLDCRVYSLDIRKPSLEHPGVTFLKGDCNAIEQALPSDLLERLPHPWMFIEDAHVNVAGVLEWIHAFLQSGDYMVVEDTTGHDKQAQTAPFVAAHSSEYKVDTRYTDFFGYNACSSRDSIWRRE